ncbi:uncharacterized protein LOC111403494 isoform X2 [Olea europaea var. sylvestris]|uniref:uncharacterized protein LOC111403494 isoform X2 n=1 Tax=Olea europaea var. sylvestris TaxID=158386 RepID=UPI000C1D28A2|nr:uncharacterized protein LOC111403494 isoform X2 [Olea europaea var. sylvestris]
MPPASILLVFVTVAVAVAVAMEVLPDAAVFGGEGKSLTLTLERTSHNGVEMSQLRDRDRVRHVRFLQQQLTGVVDFQVEGTYDPFIVGLYYTKVKLGTPPKEFYVQIDTGSDVLWVSCNSCNGCPTSSGLQIEDVIWEHSLRIHCVLVKTSAVIGSSTVMAVGLRVFMHQT